MHVCDFVVLFQSSVAVVVDSCCDGPFVAAGANFVVYGIYHVARLPGQPILLPVLPVQS
jgi:hypothetical protein